MDTIFSSREIRPPCHPAADTAIIMPRRNTNGNSESRPCDRAAFTTQTLCPELQAQKRICMNHSTFPPELTALPQWTCYKLVPRTEGHKLTKPPYQVTGRRTR